MQIPSAEPTEDPWHVGAGVYKVPTGDNMQFCQNFDGQGMSYTKAADCHTSADFYRGAYYKGQAPEAAE